MIDQITESNRLLLDALVECQENLSKKLDQRTRGILIELQNMLTDRISATLDEYIAEKNKAA